MVANIVLVLALLTSIEPALRAADAPEPDALRCADGSAVADAAIRACTRLLNSGRYDEAGRVAWLSNRGLHRHRSGRLVEAAQDFSDAIALQPDAAQLYLNRGAAYGMAGALEKALLDFEKVIKLEPGSADGHMNRATALEKMGRYAESLAGYDTAITLVPDNWIAWDGRCWLRAIIGTDLPGAMSDCERALALRPDAANIMNTQGFILFRQKRFDEAIISYDRSIALDPSVASSFYVRGLARQALGHDGSEDIAKGVAMEPGIGGRYASYGLRP